jgi:hypothetical protein
MQKKKRSFQVIPNYSINGIRNWNESKKCLRNKAVMILAGATPLTAAGQLGRLIGPRQTVAAISWLEPNCTILTRNGAAQ